MSFTTSPYLLKDTSVSQVMIQVCIALIPGIAAYVWLIGPAILVQLVIATFAALLAEAAMLRIQRKPLAIFLSDGSAIVTAWLIALTFPPLAPWWLVFTGTVFAIVIAKHLYGGLGQNPFNPAMVAFAVCIVSFPALMSLASSVGIQPRVRTSSRAMRTDTPRAREAAASRSGRQRSALGRMTKCSNSHNASSNSHSSARAVSSQRSSSGPSAPVGARQR